MIYDNIFIEIQPSAVELLIHCKRIYTIKNLPRVVSLHDSGTVGIWTQSLSWVTLYDPTQFDPPAHGSNPTRFTAKYKVLTQPDLTCSYSSKWGLYSHVKPLSQLRFDYDTTTIRRYHDAFDYDESDRNYDLRSIRLRYIDMFIFCSRRMEAGARDTS